MVRWPLRPLQPLQKIQLQPPFGPSVDSLCHPWFTTANLSYKVSYFWNFRHRLVRYYWYHITSYYISHFQTRPSGDKYILYIYIYKVYIYICVWKINNSAKLVDPCPEELLSCWMAGFLILRFWWATYPVLIQFKNQWPISIHAFSPFACGRKNVQCWAYA